MQFLHYLILAIISSVGLAVGIILAKVTEEELKEGSVFFPWIQRTILLSTIAIIFIILRLYYYIIPLLLVAILLFIYIALNKKSTLLLSYGVLGVLLSLSSNHLLLTEVTSGLAFFFGFPTGSLMYYHTKKKHFSAFMQQSLPAILLFLVIALACFFLFKTPSTMLVIT